MKIVLLVLAYVLIPFAAKALLDRCLNSYKSKDNCVELPLYVLVIGIVCTVFFIALITIMAFGDQFSWLVASGFFTFVLLGVSLIIGYCRCRIQFNEVSFSVTGFFTKTRIYTYNDITGIRDNRNTCTLYCGKQRVDLDKIASGSKEFLEMAKKQYKRHHGGMGIPKATPKKDPFNGHIRNPWEFVIAYALVFLLTLIMIVFLIVLVNRTYDETNTTLIECCFVNYEMDGKEYVFISDKQERFKIEFALEDEFASRLCALSDGKAPLSVYVREVTPENEKPYYGIEQIQVGESIVLSFDQSRELGWRSDGRWTALFIGVIIVICWLMIVFSVIIGRNPSKYPRKIVRLFFKDGYVIFDE